jgi:formimidoylglutamate deiminase
MYRATSSLEPDDLYTVSRQAFVEMALTGITTVGEFHYLHHDSRGAPYADRNELAKQVIRAARDVGMRIALLRVGYERSGYQLPEKPEQRRFIDPDVATFLRAANDLRSDVRADPLVTVGLAPHSVRAVSRSWLEAVAASQDYPIHMHVAEQPAEVAACRAEHRRRPVELLEEVGLLRPNFTAVHAIHVEPGEIISLGRSHVNVCACPSTERNLGDGIVPGDELARAGVTLCLGSDSQATVDLLDEARQLEGHLRLLRFRRVILEPVKPGAGGLALNLLQMATRNGAHSLGVSSGKLFRGAPADFFTVDLNHPSVVGTGERDLLSAIVFGAEKGAIRDVAVGGRFIVRDGVHALAEESGRAFTAVARKVFG